MGSQAESIVATALREARRQLTLERALQLTIVTSIVVSVLAAGAILGWLETARTLRWPVLAALVVLSLAYAWRSRGGPKPVAVYAAAAAFLALALISAAWSASPALTAARWAALTLLFLACGALAYATAGRPEAIRTVLDAVLIGAVVVAVGGLVVLAFAYDRAVAPATTVLPARYQGLGGGPNTAMMVLSVGVPLAAHALVEARTRLVRLAAGFAFLLLLGSIVASGSRGALAASFAGILAYAVLDRTKLRPRLAAAAVVFAVFGAALFISRIPQPLPPGSKDPPTASIPPDPNPAPVRPRPGFADANLVLRLQDEVGHPGIGVADPDPQSRHLFDTSGRVDAWAGALGQAGERPLLGYGFGTEERVFVDRYVDFNAGVPENSYVGLVLQLGALGAVAFATLIGVLVLRTGRALRVLPASARGIAAACAGGFVAGLVLALSQSYIYAVGNNATGAVWLCAFLLVASTSRPAAGARS